MTEFFKDINFIPRENSGSRSTNRLILQVSFAMIKIVENHDKDFIVVLDLVDDVAIISKNKSGEQITTYQLKTASNKEGIYRLNKLITDDVFYKMYDHLNQMDSRVERIYLVTNYPIKHRVNKKDYWIAEKEIQLKNIPKELVPLIEDNMKKDSAFNTLGFSDKFYYSLWEVPINEHYEISKIKLINFLADEYSYLDIKTINVLHQTIHDILTVKQSYEFEITDDMHFVLKNKSFSSNEFKSLVLNAASVGALTIDFLKKEYLFNLNLMEEIKWTQALANFKTKIISSPNILNNNMEEISEKVIDFLSKSSSRIELLNNVKFIVYPLILSELNEYEKDILIITVIEEIFKRGIDA